MADNWYYVQKGNRQGPVALEVIETMVSQLTLTPEDFVWKKGFENWKKIKEVSELQVQKTAFEPDIVPEIVPQASMSLGDLEENARVIFIRVGNDRGGESADYGPFGLKQLKQLYKENRINAKTFIFSNGMKDWIMLADLSDYQKIFEELPPVIQESEKRVSMRKPFVARLFIQNNKNVYEGICRDISIGGMQVLVNDFQGKAGDKITINVHPENSAYHFTASGMVVRILEGKAGFSFRFQGLNEEASRSIEKYLQS